MELDPPPVANARRSASSRLQIWSSTTTPSTRHSLKCYTINARSRGNRSVSAQDQDNSDAEAAAPHDANRVQTVEAPIQGRYPLVLMVKGHRVHCMSKFAEDVAQRVNSQTFQPGDVQGFVRDDKTDMKRATRWTSPNK